MKSVIVLYLMYCMSYSTVTEKILSSIVLGSWRAVTVVDVRNAVL